MTNKRASHWALVLVGVVCFLTPIASWLASVLGLPVRSLLSDEGIRWFFLHGVDTVLTMPVVYMLFAILALCPMSWMVRDIRRASSIRGRRKQAIYASGLFVAACLLALLLLAVIPQSPLQGLTGGLFPSPLMHGLYGVLCVMLALAALLYGIISNPSVSISEILTFRIVTLAPWLMLAIMLNFLWNMIHFMC